MIGPSTKPWAERVNRRDRLRAANDHRAFASSTVVLVGIASCALCAYLGL